MRGPRCLSLLTALFLVFAAETACGPYTSVREYSATVVVSRYPYHGENDKAYSGSTYRAKAYVTREYVRVDFAPSATPRPDYVAGFWDSGRRVVLRFADQSGWVVDPRFGEQAENLAHAPREEGNRVISNLFCLRPESVSGTETNLCSDGKAVPFPYPDEVDAAKALQLLLPEKCTRLGEEILHGRRVIKWQALRPDTRTPIELWVDRDLGIFLKVSGPGSSYELVDLRQKRQKPSLFDRPQHFIE